MPEGRAGSQQPKPEIVVQSILETRIQSADMLVGLAPEKHRRLREIAKRRQQLFVERSGRIAADASASFIDEQCVSVYDVHARIGFEQLDRRL
jgi:hypothetical protein